VPLARVALLRRAIYAFVIVDVLLLHTSGFYHGWADPAWYQPLVMGRILHLPAASVPLVELLRAGCVLGALVALTGRLPRLAGWATAVGWIWFQYVAFSYGKVDHDRGDFAVALALLPLIGVAQVSDRRLSEAAGFVFRAIQLTAIATYFLSAWAKVRFGGWDWVNSATIVRAVVRRGSWFGDQMLRIPWSLHAFQWLLFSLEMLSPVIFLVTERWRRRMIGGWYLFHALTYAAITIAFGPHLVMLLVFLPLEEYRDKVLARRRSRRPDPDQPDPEPGADQPAAVVQPPELVLGGSAQAGVPPGSRLRFRATQR
jgi:hydrogenase/urease accessory protein HupE